MRNLICMTQLVSAKLNNSENSNRHPIHHFVLLVFLLLFYFSSAHAQEWESPTSDEVTLCDPIVRRYHQQKYPEMLAKSDAIMAQNERSGSRLIHIHGGGRDRALAARTNMTVFLSDAHKLPTLRKELLQQHKNNIDAFIENPARDIAGYFAVLACASAARLASMDGKPFVIPKSLLGYAGSPEANTTDTESSKNAESTGDIADGKCNTYEQCLLLENASGLDAKMKALPTDNINLQTRGIIATSGFMIRNYQQCLSDNRCQTIVDQHRKTQEGAMEVCRKLSTDPSSCTVSPF